MNQVKNRLAALSVLDRAFRLLPDATIVALYDALEEDGQDAMQHIAGVKGSDPTPEAFVVALREVVLKGRMNGDLERAALVLTETCLNDCVEALGSNADDPSEENLRDVLPGVIERHGLGVTQVMLATVVTGEAIASPIIVRILKHDDAWKVPPAPEVTIAPLRTDD
ncbi:MAG: hypothetical protein ACKOJ9_01095, partial [Actinomycetota bacterium]